jgi:two-component system chemotaxis response regulator CheB
MPGHDIIVMGASAGGIGAVTDLIQGLPADLPAAVFVVVHVPPHAPSSLPRIFSGAGVLRAAHAVDGERIRHGRIYVAPPDWHLALESERVRLERGPREHHSRPALDVLFRSAARAFGPRVVGVVLSGSLDDGTLGLRAVKRAGGLAMVQDPQEALFPEMPESAIAYVSVDYVLPVVEMPATLVRLAHQPIAVKEVVSVAAPEEREEQVVHEEFKAEEQARYANTRSTFACPECGGVLWELHDGDLVRFRCPVGHAYSDEDLLSLQDDRIESALWSAVRALRERAALSRNRATRLERRGKEAAAASARRRAGEADRQAQVLRDLLAAPPRSIQDEE